MKTRIAMRHARPSWERRRRRRSPGVGEPSYTSGVHMWNGTAEILKAIPASTKTRPTMGADATASAVPGPWRWPGRTIVPVKP